MFERIDFSSIKEHTWDDYREIDLSGLRPNNLRYTLMRDGSLSFKNVKDNLIEDLNGNSNADLNEYYNIVKKDIYLQIQICSTYFYYKNFGIMLTSHLICNALKLNIAMVNKICMLFKSVVIDEEYPLFKNNRIIKYVQSIEITGLSKIGIDLAKIILDNNSCLKKLYDRSINCDLEETLFFKYNPKEKIHVEKKWISLVDEIMENKYLRKCGVLNVSSLTFNELNRCELCSYFSQRVKELYLFNYDLEFDGKSYYVKYLHWF